jgi:hypothetical protein
MRKRAAVTVSLLFVVLTSASHLQSPRWRISSHLKEWQDFLDHADAENIGPALELYYVQPNRDIFLAISGFTGISDISGLLQEGMKGVPIAELRAGFQKIRKKNLESTAAAALTDSLAKLPSGRYQEGCLHIVMLSSLFDGIGLLSGGGPAIVLNADRLVSRDDRLVKILTAHEFHHAVRQYLLREPDATREGLLNLRAKDILISEGLAVAFSEEVYPGGEVKDYIPFFSQNPDKFKGIIRQEKQITNAILQNREKTISDPLISRYFYGSGPTDMSSPYRNAAYYIGYKIIKRKVAAGFSLDRLTAMTAEDILVRKVSAGGSRRPRFHSSRSRNFFMPAFSVGTGRKFSRQGSS